MRTLKIMALGLAVLAFSGVALHADTLYLGGPYTNVDMIVNSSQKTEGGGSIQNSTLNGNSLPWVYCVDLFDNIPVPGTYPSTTVTHDGSMTGLTLDSQGLTGFNNGSGTVNNAAQVAYLLQTYAAGADQAALQAAIWHEIYGSAVYLDTGKNNSTIIADYNTYLNGVGTGNVGNFSWLSPGDGLQGLITQYDVPDGGMTLMLLGGTLVGVGTLRRKFRV